MNLQFYRSSCLPDDPRYVIKPRNYRNHESWYVFEPDPGLIYGWYDGDYETILTSVPETDWNDHYQSSQLGPCWEDFPESKIPAIPLGRNWHAAVETEPIFQWKSGKGIVFS